MQDNATRLALCLITLASLPCSVHAHEQGDCADDPALDTRAARESAHEKLQWKQPGWEAGARAGIPVQLLGINDFHGQLSAGRRVADRPVGGAAVLASYLQHEQAEFSGATFIVHAGDHVGASPPASALLQDEPAITFLNMLTNDACREKGRAAGGRGRQDKRAREDGGQARCNLVGTLGNHEFDEGVDELLRLIYGGTHANGPFLDPDYAGASFPYVCANVVDAESGKPIVPPYVIRRAGAAKLAFIGAVLKETPTIVTPSGVAGLRFLDEAEAINRYVPELREQHVEAIVVLIHQGGRQTSYTGPTDPASTLDGAEINRIVTQLDSAVDVVVSGHAHAFSNALVRNANGQPILVVQAFSAGTAYDDIELTLDAKTGDVVAKSSSIVTTWADEGPGLTPDPAVSALVTQAEQLVAPLVNEVVATAADALTREQNDAGESALGNVIADAQRAAMDTDFAFMNPGGIRADLDAGPVTWGELFTIQPFGNSLVKLDLTGEQVYALLEQQWAGQSSARIMQISGLSYTWDNDLPVGSRVVDVRHAGTSIDPAASYSVTCNSFLASGGDNFTVFTQGTGNLGGPVDLDALIAYLQGLQSPVSAGIEGRIVRLH